jgi:hypothetical protein
MNQFEVLCANLNCSDPYRFGMTQNCVGPSQNGALQFKTIQHTPEQSRRRHCPSIRVTKKIPDPRNFWGAKPITGVEVSGATGAHRHLELQCGTNDDWERDKRDTVVDSGGVLQPPQGIPEDVQAACRSALETKEENRQPMAISRRGD